MFYWYLNEFRIMLKILKEKAKDEQKERKKT